MLSRLFALKARASHTMAQSQPTPAASGITKRVFVGNLNWKTSWQSLKDHMNKAGTAKYVEILVDGQGRSKGGAIVEYETPEQAANAIKTLTDTNLEGRPIFVREDRDDIRRGGSQGKRLYIGNLAYSIKWQELKDLFTQIGPVARADVLTDPTGRSRGAGTIIFENPEDTAKAIAQFHNKDFQGRPMIVREDRFA